MKAEELLNEITDDIGITMSTLSKTVAVEAMEEYAQQQCKKRDELIKAMDEYIHLLICSSYPENNVTTQDFKDSESKIEQLKSEIQ
jgi:hypothetical protein